MQLFLQTPPIEEPLTLDEVKAYLKIHENQEEGFLQSIISSARAYVECFTGRALLKQRWHLQIRPRFPPLSPLVKYREEALEIELPYPPLMRVEEVKVKEKTTAFKQEENRVVLDSSHWDQEISIHYWAGYGEKASSLPPALKMAVLMATRPFYDHQPVDLSILNPFKVHRLM